MAAGSQAMWNIPSNGGIPPAGVPFTVPICQKPPRPVVLCTELSIFTIAPPGSMAPSPVQDQVPPKNLRAAISAGGLGWAGGAAKAADTRAMTRRP